MLNNYKENFIKFMVRCGVLTFGDFTTKSGRKTPYFINTGNYRTGSAVEALGHYYARALYDKLGDDFDALFGPAYKGIPLVTLTAAALWKDFGIDKGYCFNRKEEKDHGEGGSMVGFKLQDNHKVVIIEDVITAGTAIRETLPVLKKCANVDVSHMFISVNRMEKGNAGITAIEEIKEEFGISVHSIVTVKDIIRTLHNTELDGKVFVDDTMKNKIEQYMEKYCVEC